MQSPIFARQLASVCFLSLTLVACGQSEEKKDAETDRKEEVMTTDSANESGQTESVQTENDTTMTEDTFKAENLAFLETNKDKDGVTVTESGLQYRVLNAGDENGVSPKPESIVQFHYSGRLIDGTEFDSSYQRNEPLMYPAGRLIPGWVEALQMMKPGDKWELVIPSDLGYGDQGVGPIPGGATLVFDVELLQVLTEEEAEKLAMQKQEEYKQEQVDFLTENAKKDGVQVTESGLQYKILEDGTGPKPAGASSSVTVHYAGTLISGQEFDSSYKRGEPATFALNQVIGGWTEGVQLMSEGATYEFYIPQELGYGARGSHGSIPPFATLIFKVELVKVND